MHHHNVDELNLKKIVRKFKKNYNKIRIYQKEDLQNILTNLKKANKISDENLFASNIYNKILSI